MSDASTDHADRPAEVTDPLLWDLAAAVADAHQPDDNQVCASPSCVGAAWPCAAWDSAQEGLRAARAPQPAPAAPAGGTDERRDDPSTGWSGGLVPAARPEPVAATSAA
ncbi:hypothetical protein ONA70_24695 [Micromonospora yasonensis]|uniref:hypothetical protein n=1 Tax=Micromonospora yasonensis TaxID=1128667 RepID=UPI00223101B3|nr:hypothetical protein [Micromonospora yasonensis]MCW3843306.1 hypothetical protein [Micromonospora yasonensis]